MLSMLKLVERVSANMIRTPVLMCAERIERPTRDALTTATTEHGDPPILFLIDGVVTLVTKIDIRRSRTHSATEQRNS